MDSNTSYVVLEANWTQESISLEGKLLGSYSDIAISDIVV